MIPAATVKGSLPFVDALFTATSATCVTGLVVLDTGRDFTLFGQGVILFLIQVGGLGIMTLSTFFMYLVAGRLSVTGRDIVQDTLSQHPMANLARLLKVVFGITILIEGAGGLLLALRFMGTYPPATSLYLGFFHAVSAFCNAGFGLFPDSFISYKTDVVVNAVLIALIIIGGLGFVVVSDLLNIRRWRTGMGFRSLRYHTRIVLFMTGLLVAGGFVLFWVLESRNSLKELSPGHQILAALFQSVTTRTAGFNTVELQTLTNSTLFFFIIFMFIGASPGSCGGGIKTTTFAVIFASVLARFRAEEDVNIFYRRVPGEIVSRAISVLFFSGFIVAFFTIVLLITELPRVSHMETRGLFLEYLFEVVSAFATVGLSTGVTPKLSSTGRLLVTLLMFIGRLGPLTIAIAVQGHAYRKKYRYVQDNLLVG